MQDKAPRNKDGQEHGLWEFYHKNGQLRYKGLYINGNRFGKHVDYYASGKLCYISNCINGEYYGYYEYLKQKLYYAR